MTGLLGELEAYGKIRDNRPRRQRVKENFGYDKVWATASSYSTYNIVDASVGLWTARNPNQKHRMPTSLSRRASERPYLPGSKSMFASIVSPST